MGIRGRTVGMLAAGAAVLAVAAMATMTTAQVSRTLAVTVVDAGGVPVVNALVCAGSVADRAGLGAARTNAVGTASLTIPAATSGSVLITGGTAGAGSASTIPAMLGFFTLRLPASGGPVCPSNSQISTAPGQLTVPRAAIDRALAEAAARPIGQGVGAINLGYKCLGAAGQNCGDRSKGEVSTCIPETGTCLVNAGSWLHDECCVRNPEGGLCDGKMEETVTQVVPGGSQVCHGEFNKAVSRLGTPFTWLRRVDFSARNTTGIVDHAAYCAPAGTLVDSAAGEQRFCCSRRARLPAPREINQLADRLRGQVAVAAIRVCI